MWVSVMGQVDADWLIIIDLNIKTIHSQLTRDRVEIRKRWENVLAIGQGLVHRMKG